MDIKPIKTAADYKSALAAIESLMTARPGSADGDRLDVLATLVEAFEARRFPMGLPDAVTAIRFRMEQQGLAPKDLEPYIGRSNRVYEILNGTRALTLDMIRRLHDGLGIPAESLIRSERARSPALAARRAVAHDREVRERQPQAYASAAARPARKKGAGAKARRRGA